MAEPRSYSEILARGYLPGRDFRVAFGDSKVDLCLLIAPHGGGIEPGTSEILRAVSEMGGWAWYEFAGFLRKGNQAELHIASTSFDEPTLMSMLPQTRFVVAFHGASDAGEPIVYVGGRWKRACEILSDSINASSRKHGIHAALAHENPVAHLQGSQESNLTNRGKRAEGVQLEFSRGARNLLFPPDCSREARGRRSPRLRPLALSIHAAVKQLCESATAGGA
jgi:phage replication-related protein YjqB (UPF0714/DUF867 family)